MFMVLIPTVLKIYVNNNNNELLSFWDTRIGIVYNMGLMIYFGNNNHNKLLMNVQLDGFSQPTIKS